MSADSKRWLRGILQAINKGGDPRSAFHYTVDVVPLSLNREVVFEMVKELLEGEEIRIARYKAKTKEILSALFEDNFSPKIATNLKLTLDKIISKIF